MSGLTRNEEDRRVLALLRSVRPRARPQMYGPCVSVLERQQARGSKRVCDVRVSLQPTTRVPRKPAFAGASRQEALAALAAADWNVGMAMLRGRNKLVDANAARLGLVVAVLRQRQRRVGGGGAQACVRVGPVWRLHCLQARGRISFETASDPDRLQLFLRCLGRTLTARDFKTASVIRDLRAIVGRFEAEAGQAARALEEEVTLAREVTCSGSLAERKFLRSRYHIFMVAQEKSIPTLAVMR